MSLFKKDTPAVPEGLGSLDTSAAAEVKVSTPAELQTPEGKAYVATAVNEAVTASVRAIFTELAPMLKNMNSGLTPEAIDLLRTPKETPEQVARKARDKRESARSREQEAELRAATEAFKNNCQHRYPNGAEALSIISNLYLAGKAPGGVCMLCHDIVLPKRWGFDSPEPETGKERPIILPAHRDYPRVLQIFNSRT